MNVASLKLCRELYELSGWSAPQKYWVLMVSGDWKAVNKDTTVEVEINRSIYPAYDLGYLLRKLPPYSRIQSMKGDVPYRVSYDNGVSERGVNADTPEDAACKLAIELFKQGILTPDNGYDEKPDAFDESNDPRDYRGMK